MTVLEKFERTDAQGASTCRFEFSDGSAREIGRAIMNGAKTRRAVEWIAASFSKGERQTKTVITDLLDAAGQADLGGMEITKEMIAAARWEFPSPAEADDEEDDEAFVRMIRAILVAAAKQ